MTRAGLLVLVVSACGPSAPALSPRQTVVELFNVTDRVAAEVIRTAPDSEMERYRPLSRALGVTLEALRLGSDACETLPALVEALPALDCPACSVAVVAADEACR